MAGCGQRLAGFRVRPVQLVPEVLIFAGKFGYNLESCRWFSSLPGADPRRVMEASWIEEAEAQGIEDAIRDASVNLTSDQNGDDSIIAPSTLSPLVNNPAERSPVSERLVGESEVYDNEDVTRDVSSYALLCQRGDGHLHSGDSIIDPSTSSPPFVSLPPVRVPSLDDSVIPTPLSSPAERAGQSPASGWHQNAHCTSYGSASPIEPTSQALSYSSLGLSPFFEYSPTASSPGPRNSTFIEVDELVISLSTLAEIWEALLELLEELKLERRMRSRTSQEYREYRQLWELRRS
ncbi:hypothetical protein FOZ62_006335 [Perkinsus olseni]|uniref:Uncharacterized protein n=1 Tax=Perkinsus olseni TaxID=32597 RepID=A0A7J6PX50_PEROL|nr:hypothetical protein FOZ62_006335 [Perkinsus olseni]